MGGEADWEAGDEEPHALEVVSELASRSFVLVADGGTWPNVHDQARGLLLPHSPPQSCCFMPLLLMLKWCRARHATAARGPAPGPRKGTPRRLGARARGWEAGAADDQPERGFNIQTNQTADVGQLGSHGRMPERCGFSSNSAMAVLAAPLLHGSKLDQFAKAACQPSWLLLACVSSAHSCCCALVAALAQICTAATPLFPLTELSLHARYCQVLAKAAVLLISLSYLAPVCRARPPATARRTAQAERGVSLRNRKRSDGEV